MIAIIRDEAQRRGLTADSDEAFPERPYESLSSAAAPIERRTRFARERLAQYMLALHAPIKRHPLKSAAIFGLLYVFACFLLEGWFSGHAALFLFFAGLLVICLPLRRYRVALLAPFVGGCVPIGLGVVLSVASLGAWGASPPATPWSVIAVVLSVGFAMLTVGPALLLSLLTFIHNRYWPVYEPGRCRICKYDLRGLPEPRCPECGTPFDPAEVTTVVDDQHSAARTR